MSDYFVSSLWGIPFLSFIFAGAGAYAGGYLKKRGENLATKDDFDDLKTQTSTLALTTKEIEAKIDDQVWNRQRQWEMKKDIALEATRTIAEADAILGRTVTAYLRGEALSDMINQCEQLWFRLAAKGNEIMIISNATTISAYTTMTKSFIDTVLRLDPHGNNQVIARNMFDVFRSNMAGFYSVLRIELGLTLMPSTASQSAESPENDRGPV